MTIDKHIETIAGRECVLFAAEGARALLVQVVSAMQWAELEGEVEQIAAAGVLFAMAAVPIEDWELELMPWAEPAVSKRPEVGSGAGETLQYIEKELLPTLSCDSKLSIFNSQLSIPIVLGGYSLGGLFALWAACQTDRFSAVAAGSPSLWAGDWPQYAATHPMLARRVYLSLGDREERSRNKTFARVGDRIRNEYSRLRQQLGPDNTTLVWEQGGHFADPAARMARAFIWTLTHYTS